MKWILPDGSIITRPRSVIVDGVAHPRGLLFKPDKAKLFGIKAYYEDYWDGKHYKKKSQTVTETEESYTVHPVIKPRYNTKQLKKIKTDHIKDSVKNNIKKAKKEIEYYNKHESLNERKEILENYISETNLKIAEIADDIDLIDDYEDIIEFKWAFNLPEYPKKNQ